WLNCLIGGIVASPTPTVPISGDSTTSMRTTSRFRRRARIAAAIHPAVPPPTIAMRRMGSLIGRPALLIDEATMRRQRLDAGANDGERLVESGARLGDVERIREWVVAPRLDTLPEQHGEPTVLVEVLLIAQADA